MGLTERVRGQWEEEARLRRVFQPLPLRVLWSSTGRPVAADRDVVLNEPGSDWGELPLRGEAGDIAAVFAGLPHRQLVVIGPPGAGKSVLVMLLTLSMVKNREPGGPVPVLLPISSWDPVAEEVEVFVARRLAEDYPDLAEPAGDGLTLAGLLVARGLVLPLLDGMDELPASLHPRAVEALDRWAAPGHPLVVTCRSGEYERAVSGGGSVISRAAVIELEPVTPANAIEFLSHPAPSRPRWQPVLSHLRKHPDGPLARTLSTPLMVTLAREVYRSPASDPAGLLALGDAAAIAASLIEGFMSSIYAADLPRPRSARGRSRRYRAACAVRWLSCLAYHLYLTGTSDLWWWQLTPGFLSPRPRRARGAIRAACILGPAGCLLPTGLLFGFWAAAWAAVTVGLAVSAGAAGWFRPMWPVGYPPYLPRRYRRPRRRRARESAARVAFAFMFGLPAALAVSMPLVGLAGSAAYGLAVLLMPALPVPAGRRRAAGPRTTLRASLGNALTAALQYGLCGA